MIHFKKGYKYQLTAGWHWGLKHKFTIKSDYRNRYYWVSAKRNEIGAYIGCAWDGATWFPDTDWIMEGSLGHDILCWLIEKGIIPEEENDLIDKELEVIIQERAPVPKWLQNRWGLYLLQFRAWYVRKGTHLANSRLGQSKPVITIPRP